jgi:diguanylate cyclase (GGDEF)-like protein
MKLQSKVILITSITWVIICLVIFADSKLTVTRAFKHLEDQLIDRDIHDTQKSYDNVLSTLILYSQAFSQWDDAYHFMQDKNKKFIGSNFVPATYTNSNINFMMYYDNHLQLYYGLAFDSSKNSLFPLPSSLVEYLKNNPQFLSHKDTADNKVGILNTKNGLILMSSLPILTSTGEGPSHGSLLMGYYLTDKDFNKLSEIVGMKLKFYPLSSISNNNLIKFEFNQLKNSQQKIAQIPINKNIVYGLILLSDINNIPIGILQIEIPQNIYLQGLSTSYHYFLIVIVLGLMVMLLTWYLLKIFVIDRVISINHQVIKINMNNQFNKTISITGNDELSTMVDAINNMIQIIYFSQNRLRYLAMHDDLTQLPNRKLFYDLLEKETIRAHDEHKKLAILFLDMDKFKEVNDQHGHAMGDQLLIFATGRIKNIIKNTDVLARQSGDEFLILMKDIKKIEYVSEMTKRILKLSDTPFRINNQEIPIKFSIGISIYPDDGTTVEELLKNADQAMYLVKEKSGNNFKFYNNHVVIS